MEHFVRKNCDSTYCNFLNIKLHHGYFSANITKFSEQVSLKHLQEHIILIMSKSDRMFARIVYKKTDKWYIKWQRVTTSGTTSKNKWKYNVKENIGRSSHRRCSIKKLHLPVLQYSQENTWRPASLLKRDSNISVFLWTLQNF